MTRIQQAEAVVEFAKANGFPNASWFLWSVEGETSYDDTSEAVMELDHGETDEFQLSIHLSDVTLRQAGNKREDEDSFSEAVEVSE